VRYRDLYQTDSFREALRSILSREQQVILLSALASLAKDADALEGKDWIEIESLDHLGLPGCRRVVVIDEGACWAAYVYLGVDVMVALHAERGRRVSPEARRIVIESFHETHRAISRRKRT